MDFIQIFSLKLSQKEKLKNLKIFSKFQFRFFIELN